MNDDFCDRLTLLEARVRSYSVLLRYNLAINIVILTFILASAAGH